MDTGDAKLRVSDAERTHVRQLLERAVGEGMLTLDEFGERLDGATADLNGVDTFAGGTTLEAPSSPPSERLHLVVRGRVRFGSLTARYSFGRGWRRMLG